MNFNHDSEETVHSLVDDNNENGKFLDVLENAKIFVDHTINSAIEKIENSKDSAIEDRCPGCDDKNRQADRENAWPKSEKMSVRAGLRCIMKMMKEWKSEPAMEGWKFFAEFIGLESDGSSDFYSYQVRWSFPTPAYPEPQVTVSVFFTVEATKTKYIKCPVDVTYIFEGNKFAHRPKMIFRPKWIYDVLDMKTMMFKSFKF